MENSILRKTARALENMPGRGTAFREVLSGGFMGLKFIGRRLLLGACMVSIALLACHGRAQHSDDPVRWNLLREFQWTDAAVDLSGARVEKEELVIPAGRAVNFFLNLPLKAEFSWGDLRIDDGAELEVVFKGRNAEARQFKVSRSNGFVPLDPGESRYCRLSLRSLGSGGGLRIGAPVIRAPLDAWNETGDKAEMSKSPGKTRDGGQDKRPNFIIYLVDTLRKDHLGVYGYQKAVSPALDAFAEHAVVFERAFTQSPWTRASVASIMTGQEPQVHGVNGRNDKVPEKALMLAEALGQGGYETAAFITNGNVKEIFGFAQGFETFIQSRGKDSRSDRLNARLFEYLDQRDDQRPLFLYAHAMDPHAPYVPPERIRNLVAGDVGEEARDFCSSMDGLHMLNRKRKKLLKAGKSLDPELTRQVLELYDGEILSNDQSFGRFVDALKAHHLYENSIIVFVADHGEAFWDHGIWSHGNSLDAELTDCPLVIKGVGVKPGRRSMQLTQHIDLFPTALDYAGLPTPETVQGHSLRRVLDGGPEYPVPPVFAVLDLDDLQAFSLQTSDWKLIVPKAVPKTYAPGKKIRLYHHSEDPRETRDLAEAEPEIRGYLLTGIRRHLGMKTSGTEQTTMDQATIDELKAIGYLQ